MDRIAFSLPDHGFRQVTGFFHLDDEFLVLDVRTALLGLGGEDKQMIKVDATALDEVYLKRGLIKDLVCLRPRRFDLLEVVPGTHDSELRLQVKRTDRARAERLVAELALRIQAAA